MFDTSDLQQIIDLCSLLSAAILPLMFNEMKANARLPRCARNDEINPTKKVDYLK